MEISTLHTLSEFESFQQQIKRLQLRELELEHQILCNNTLEISSREEKRQLAVQCINLEHDYQTLQYTYQIQSKHNEAKTKRLVRLEKEVSHLKHISKDQETSIFEMTKQLEKRDSNASKLDAKVDDLEKLLSAAKEETDRAKALVDKVKEELKAARSESKQTKDTATAKLRKEKEDASDKASELDKLLKKANAENKTISKEIETLQSQLEKANKEKEKLNASSKERSDALSKVTESETALKKAQSEIKALTKQKSALESELETASKDVNSSHTILKEKLALSRQITTLEAENESLKIASANHKDVLSEKLQLSHKIETLMLELENEKKVSKRVAKASADSGDLKKKHDKEIKDLKDQLAKQNKLTDKMLRDKEKIEADYEASNAVLEKKIDTLKSKLKTTNALAGPNKKRPATAFDGVDDTPPPKKLKKTTTQKSTFSTTPFLKRQLSLMPQSPVPSIPDQSEENVLEDATLVTVMSEAVPPAISKLDESDAKEDESVQQPILEPSSKHTSPEPPAPVVLKTKTTKPKKSDAEPKVKMLLGKTALAHTKRAPSLAPVPERKALLDDDEVAGIPSSKTIKSKKSTLNKENNNPETIVEEDPDSPAIQPVKAKKVKMRKLNNTLGNTLFDDDGDDNHWNKFRAPSVTGFSKDFSPLKQRGAGYEGVRQKFMVGKAK